MNVFAVRREVSLRIRHQPGAAMFVDYAGMTVIQDRVTDERHTVQILGSEGPVEHKTGLRGQDKPETKVGALCEELRITGQTSIAISLKSFSWVVSLLTPLISSKQNV